MNSSVTLECVSTPNSLLKAQIALIGCGVMAESIIAGLLRKKLVEPTQNLPVIHALRVGMIRSKDYRM